MQRAWLVVRRPPLGAWCLGLLVTLAAGALAAILGARAIDQLAPEAATWLASRVGGGGSARGAGLERQAAAAEAAAAELWPARRVTGGLPDQRPDARVLELQWRVVSAGWVASMLGAEHSLLALGTEDGDLYTLEKMGHYRVTFKQHSAQQSLPGRLHAALAGPALRANLTLRGVVERFAEEMAFHLLTQNCHMAAQAVFQWSAGGAGAPAGLPNTRWQRAFHALSRATPRLLQPLMRPPPPPPPRVRRLQDDVPLADPCNFMNHRWAYFDGGNGDGEESVCESWHSCGSQSDNEPLQSYCGTGKSNPDKGDLSSACACDSDDDGNGDGLQCEKCSSSPSFSSFSTPVFVLLCPFWAFSSSSGSGEMETCMPAPPPAPTPAPTASPTLPPTPAPEPTSSPTDSPTDSPTASPTTRPAATGEAIPRCAVDCTGSVSSASTDDERLRCDLPDCPGITWDCYQADEHCEVRAHDCQAESAYYDDICGAFSSVSQCNDQLVCTWKEPLSSVSWICEPEPFGPETCRGILTKERCDELVGCEWNAVSVPRDLCGPGLWAPCRASTSDLTSGCHDIGTESSCDQQIACSWTTDGCLCPETHQGSYCDVNVSLWRLQEPKCNGFDVDQDFCHGLTYANVFDESSEACQESLSCPHWYEVTRALNTLYVLSVIDNVADSVSMGMQLARVVLRVKAGGVYRYLFNSIMLLTFLTDVVGPAVVLALSGSALESLNQLKDSQCFSVGDGYETLISITSDFEGIQQFNGAMVAAGAIGLVVEGLLMSMESMEQDGEDMSPREVVLNAMSVLVSLGEAVVGYIDLFGNILAAVDGMDSITLAILNVQPMETGTVCVELNPAIDPPAQYGVRLQHGLATGVAVALVWGIIVCGAIAFCGCPRRPRGVRVMPEDDYIAKVVVVGQPVR